jgi:hypothetical protein
MKTAIYRSVFVISVMASVIVSRAVAQKSPPAMASGIYLTAQDFRENKLSSHAVTDSRNSLHQHSDNVILVRDGKKSKLSFGKLSGFYKDGFRYRAHGSRKRLFSTYGYYKIIDESGLIIYSKYSAPHKSGGRMWYYYSVSIDSPIKSLTPANLQKDFADYPVFLDFVKVARRNGTLAMVVNDKPLINELYLKKVKGE